MAISRICLLLIFCSFQLAAQELDSLLLDPVEITADPISEYSSGGKKRDVSNQLDGIYSSSDLSAFLMANTPIYMRQLGAAGQTSTISFRGTGAGHSAVYWNGININSMTLGQTDFSLVPLVAAEKLSVLYGSGASLTGTDAIGGSIHMSTESRPIVGTQISFSQELGSFGMNHSRLSFRTGNKRWQHSTKIYYTGIENDFDTNYRDSTYSQNNAASINAGLLHRSVLKLNKTQWLAFDGWYHQSNRELQPKVGDFSNTDELKNESIRLLMSYKRVSKFLNLRLRGGFVLDDQEYNHGETYGTSRWTAGGEMDHQIFKTLKYRVGFDLMNIQTMVDKYTNDIQETRTDLYVSLTYNPLPDLILSANLRQTLVLEFNAPLTPSLGADLNLWTLENQQIKLRGMISRSYKVPTFNDRYWNPGGNPDLDSEKGWSWETGLTHELTKDNWNLKSDVGWFYLSVEDWIMWIPQGSLWSPENVRKVNSKGIEIEEELNLNFRKTMFSIKANLSWIHAVNQLGIVENDETVGKLLPYTPEWNANIGLTVINGPFNWSLSTRYVGERFTEQSNMGLIVEAYQVWDTGIEYEKKFNRIEAKLRFTVFNLTHQDYENFLNRAMPGRSYQLGLYLNTIKF